MATTPKKNPQEHAKKPKDPLPTQIKCHLPPSSSLLVQFSITKKKKR